NVSPGSAHRFARSRRRSRCRSPATTPLPISDCEHWDRSARYSAPLTWGHLQQPFVGVRPSSCNTETCLKQKGNGAKPKGERQKKTAPPKKTAEEISDRQRQALLLSHRRKLKPLLETERLAKAAVAKAKELAKKEGITWKDLQLAIQLESEEGEEKA